MSALCHENDAQTDAQIKSDSANSAATLNPLPGRLSPPLPRIKLKSSNFI